MADDVMTFPDTWEEFEKHFGFYDIKQAYMFGNTRLIPSFRVQQWLNHLDDINRKKQSQKNKIEAVAQLFGKDQTSKYGWVLQYHASFTEKGLTVFSKNKDVILRQLLTDRYCTSYDYLQYEHCGHTECININFMVGSWI